MLPKLGFLLRSWCRAAVVVLTNVAQLRVGLIGVERAPDGQSALSIDAYPCIIGIFSALGHRLADPDSVRRRLS